MRVNRLVKRPELSHWEEVGHQAGARFGERCMLKRTFGAAIAVATVGLVGLMLDRIMIVLQRLVSFDGAPASV